jgi:hypothetical protein
LVGDGGQQLKRLVIDKARLLCPDFPGKLDDPAFNIGEKWCSEQGPNCDALRDGRVCPLSGICKKIEIA